MSGWLTDSEDDRGSKASYIDKNTPREDKGASPPQRRGYLFNGAIIEPGANDSVKTKFHARDQLKTELEPQDIDLIADKVVEKLKPVLAMTSMQEQRDNLMTVSSLAEYMAVSAPFIYKLTQAKEIPHIKKGNKLLLFRRKDIDKWLDSYHIPALQQSRRILKLLK